MDEKIQLRRQILMTIAKFNNVELAPEQIVVELMSGGSLTERAGLLDILERCRRRELHTVICFDIDRLTRDVADLKTITQAFFRGGVTLITQRGVHQFDRNYDTTLIQILAVLGEKERRSFSFRRKATNEQRARAGQMSQGLAPYGYRWDPECKVFRVHPTEYPIAEEIFRRFWREGSNSIARDLNQRGVPGPGAGKRDNASPVWLRGSVAAIVRNPFYTGHLVKRRDVDRDGQSAFMPATHWIWSEEPLLTLDDDGAQVPLPHPVTVDQWEQLQEITHGRRVGQPTKGLLTGLISCCEGRPMQRHNDHYSCECGKRGNPHPGMHVLRESVDRLLWQVIGDALVPIAAAPVPKRAASAAESRAARLDSERRAAQRELREKEETLQDLVQRSSFYRRLPHYGTLGSDGTSAYDRTVETLAEQCARLKARIDDLAGQLESADMRRTSPLLLQFLRAGGTIETLRAAPIELQRGIVHLIVKRVWFDPPPTPRAMTRTMRVELYPLTAGPTEFSISIPHPRMGVARGPYRRAAEAHP